MKLIDIMTAPWAIEPSKLLEIRAIYEAHVRGEKIDLTAVESRLGRPLSREQQGYEVRDNVAIVPIEGVIAQRANIFSRISGAASSQLIERDIRGALADSSVRAILLTIDSPGGTVHGTQELADLIDRAREEKPIASLATAQMASAAMWIGAAADRVYITGDIVMTGNIGIVATHVDRSAQDQALGVKRSEIVAGKYKRVVSATGPLSEEGQAHMQAMVDYIYSVFVGDVAAYRGVSVEQALSAMAEGRTFIGRQAIEAGLVDGVATLDDAVAMLSEGRMPRRAPTRKQPLALLKSGGDPAPEASAASHVPEAGGAPADGGGDVSAGGAPAAETQQDPPQTQTGEEMDKITRDRILAESPDLAEAFRAEGRAAGAAAELARIQSVEAQALPGHAALINTLKFDGKTTGPEAAAQVLAAERGKLGKKSEDILADAGALSAAKPSASEQGAPKPSAEQQPAAGEPVTDESIKAAWDKDANVRGEFGGDFASYSAFRKAEASGRLRVLGGKKSG